MSCTKAHKLRSVKGSMRVTTELLAVVRTLVPQHRYSVGRRPQTVHLEAALRCAAPQMGAGVQPSSQTSDERHSWSDMLLAASGTNLPRADGSAAGQLDVQASFSIKFLLLFTHVLPICCVPHLASSNSLYVYHCP